MIKSLFNTAAAIALTAAVAGAALASEGEYYNGVNSNAGVSLDRAVTGSIASHGQKSNRDAVWSMKIDNGDYYQGADRPN
ncbi:hypothetical protein [Rhizobium sp. LCM 4573]|uniref:hypothetical protein n=1 Tax=Rhizobium sp. LCM 4573 TaxID=1848291 RepID=UPI0008DAE20C|nr:hypothetical protein [Rhizobium sp. LCM 4573]OHV82585.1 hypothetical protein LCM4573_16425 [Rhizobium sp. LCM 4573]